MNIWATLLRKDFLEARTQWLIFLIIIIAGGAGLLISLASGAAPEIAGIAIVFVTVIIGIHFVLTPIYMFRLLRTEWRTTASLWLQVPIPGWLMLLSKLAVSLFFVLTTWIAASLLTYGLTALTVSQPTLFQSMVANPHHFSLALYAAVLPTVVPRFAAFGLIAVLAVGTYLSVWVMLVMLTIKATKHRLGRGSTLIAVALILIPTWGFSALRGIAGFRTLMALGPLILPLGLPASPTYWPVHLPVDIVVAALGSTVFYALVTAGVLLASGWLLDRKVEV